LAPVKRLLAEDVRDFLDFSLILAPELGKIIIIDEGYVPFYMAQIHEEEEGLISEESNKFERCF
jgi:hypothetical protein